MAQDNSQNRGGSTEDRDKKKNKGENSQTENKERERATAGNTGGRDENDSRGKGRDNR